MVFLCWVVSKQVLLSYYFFLVVLCAPLFGDGISGRLSNYLMIKAITEERKLN